jgi:CRISPR-associated endonuclease/helicase Cas3
LYWKANSLDEKDIIKLLTPEPPDRVMQFRTAGEQFRIIDDDATRTIFVPYKEGENLLKALKNPVNPAGPLLRKLQRYAVNIYVNQFNELERRGSLEEIMPGVFALNNKIEYDKDIGLLVDETPRDSAAFVC